MSKSLLRMFSFLLLSLIMLSKARPQSEQGGNVYIPPQNPNTGLNNLPGMYAPSKNTYNIPSFPKGCYYPRCV